MHRLDQAVSANQRQPFQQRHARHLESGQIQGIRQLHFMVTRYGERQMQPSGHFLLVIPCLVARIDDFRPRLLQFPVMIPERTALRL